MKHLRDLPIRVKLLGLIALSSMLSLLVAGAVMVAYDLVIYKRNSIASATTLAEMVGSISSAALAFGDRKAATEYLGTLRARRDIQCAALYTSNGQLFVSYQRSEQNPCAFGWSRTMRCSSITASSSAASAWAPCTCAPTWTARRACCATPPRWARCWWVRCCSGCSARR
jgi:hypothetical protein